MPYLVSKVAGGWAVFKKIAYGGRGARVNKTPHPTKEKARKHIMALYLAERNSKNK